MGKAFQFLWFKTSGSGFAIGVDNQPIYFFLYSWNCHSIACISKTMILTDNPSCIIRPWGKAKTIDILVLFDR